MVFCKTAVYMHLYYCWKKDFKNYSKMMTG